MNEITAAAADLWNFLVYPVVLLVIVVGVVMLVSLPEPGWHRSLASTPVLMEWKDEENHKLLETYGITKVAPLALLFTFVFLLYATRAVVHTAGDFLPGEITYDPANVLLRSGNPGDVATFWVARPGISTARDLGDHYADLANRLRVQDSTSIGVNSLRWQHRQARAAMRFDASKAIILLASIVLVFRLRVRERRFQRVRNYLGVVLCAFTAAVYFSSRQIYALEQRGYADFDMIQFAEHIENRPAIADSASVALREARQQAIVAYLADPRNRWWRFGWVTNHQPRWFGCTLRAGGRLSERCG